MPVQSEKGPRSQCQNISIETKKNCADCGTYKTPLCRGDQLVPSLCAMHVGSEAGKRERTALGLNKKEDKKSKNGNSSKMSSNSRINTNLGDDLMQRRKLGEEKQAAVLLMALFMLSLFSFLVLCMSLSCSLFG